MAKLNPVLVWSLARDLQELVKIGAVMIERVADFEPESWKYPGTPCGQVQCEDKQKDPCGRYVNLLELVIDRLYLVLYVAVVLIEDLPQISDELFAGKRNVTRPPGVSLGTITSLLWKRLQIVCNLFGDQASQETRKNPSDKTDRSSQTDDRCLTRCESCDLTMGMIRTLISKIVHCTTQLNIDSTINNQKRLIEQDLMKLSQVGAANRWCTAIAQDVTAITYLTKETTAKNVTLGKTLEETARLSQEYEEQARSAQERNLVAEKERQEAETKLQQEIQTRNESETACQKRADDVSKISEMYEESRAEMADAKEELERTIGNCESKLMDLKSDYMNEIEALRNDKSEVEKKLEEAIYLVQQMQEKLDTEQINRREFEKRTTADMESVRGKAQKEMMNCTAMKEDFERRLAEYERQQVLTKETYEMKIASVERDLQEKKRHEKLLLECPDLNGPLYNKVEETEAKRRDPLSDMEKQINANLLRIQLLQEQNAGLVRTVSKLRSMKCGGKKKS